MQRTQALAIALRKLLALIEDEALRNPTFAEHLEEITSSLPTSARRPTRKKTAPASETPPDVLAVYQEKGEEESRFWLRSLNIRLLKAIVKANGFDPGRSSPHWTQADKFVDLIAEQTGARLRRGSAFLPPKAFKEPGPEGA